MADGEENSVDLDEHLKKLGNQLTDLYDEGNNDSEGSANAGSSSASRKGARKSKKRVEKSLRDRHAALTRPSSLGQIKPPRLVGETIETNIENGVVHPSGEFSQALPNNPRRIRPEITPPQSLNPGRKADGVLGRANLPAIRPPASISAVGAGASSLDLLQNAGGIATNGTRAQDVGKASPITGGGDSADLGKHLVQIWEHIRDTLDDIKDLLKEASGGHRGEMGGIAPVDKSGGAKEGSSNFLENLEKALFPALALLGALLVNKFGPVVAGVVNDVKRFASGLEDAGKNVERTFEKIGDVGKAIKEDVSNSIKALMKGFHIPNPVAKAREIVGDTIARAEDAAPAAMRAARAIGRGASTIASNAGTAVGRLTRSAAGTSMHLLGGVAKTVARPLGAAAGVMVGVDTVRHGMGAYNDYKSGNKIGAITNSMRALADIEEAGGPKNTLGMVADAAHFVPFGLGKGAESFLNKFAKSKGGGLLNKGLAFGIKQVRSRLAGAAGGAAVGAIAGGGPEDVVADVVGGVAGFVAPQLIGHELRRGANFIDSKYNKQYKPTKEEMDGWKPNGHTGNAFVDKYVVDPTNWVGNKINSIVSPIDKNLDKMVKPIQNAMPHNLDHMDFAQFADKFKSNLGKEIKDALLGTINSQLAARNVGNQLKDVSAGHQTFNFTFTNPLIQNDDHAKQIVEKAFKAKAAQEAQIARANERYGNLGLPAQTSSAQSMTA